MLTTILTNADEKLTAFPLSSSLNWSQNGFDSASSQSKSRLQRRCHRVLGWCRSVSVHPHCCRGPVNTVLRSTADLDDLLGLKRQDRLVFCRGMVVCMFLLIDFLLNLYLIPKYSLQYPQSGVIGKSSVPGEFIQDTLKSRTSPLHHHPGWDTLEIHNLWMPLYSRSTDILVLCLSIIQILGSTVTRCKAVLSNKTLDRHSIYCTTVLVALPKQRALLLFQ